MIDKDLSGTAFLGPENVNAALHEAEDTGQTPKDVLAEWVSLGRTVLESKRLFSTTEPAPSDPEA